jgi:hypothetical protein
MEVEEGKEGAREVVFLVLPWPAMVAIESRGRRPVKGRRRE